MKQLKMTIKKFTSKGLIVCEIMWLMEPEKEMTNWNMFDSFCASLQSLILLFNSVIMSIQLSLMYYDSILFATSKYFDTLFFLVYFIWKFLVVKLIWNVKQVITAPSSPRIVDIGPLYLSSTENNDLTIGWQN